MAHPVQAFTAPLSVQEKRIIWRRASSTHGQSSGLVFRDPVFGSLSRSLAKPLTDDRFVDLVVKAPASRAADPGFDSRLLLGDFRCRVIPCSDLEISTPVAILPGPLVLYGQRWDW